MSQILKTGAPHSSSLIRQYRNANYNLPKVINECVDNIIKKKECSSINITTEISEDGYLTEIRISDNYLCGFEDMDKTGVNNPMNMGHVSARHADDDETSEYGVGLKAGSVAVADELKIYTKVPSLSKNYFVYFNFIRMMEEVDVNESYNPKIKMISDTDYLENHPYLNGSTIIMSKIRQKAYSKTTQQEITMDLLKTLSNTYGHFLERVNIKVNGQNVVKPYDFFSDPKCIVFTIRSKVYIIQNSNGYVQYLFEMSNGKNPRQYNKKHSSETKKSEKNDSNAITRENLNILLTSGTNIYPCIPNCNYPLEVSSTFTFYSDNFLNDDYDADLLPKDRVDIYKDKRLYGSKPLKEHRNGSHNFTVHKVEFNSKEIGKQLGITFNKDISIDIMKNDLVDCIREILVHHRKEFNADTGTPKNRQLCDIALKNGYIAENDHRNSILKKEKEDEISSSDEEPEPIIPQPIRYTPESKPEPPQRPIMPSNPSPKPEPVIPKKPVPEPRYPTKTDRLLKVIDYLNDNEITENQISEIERILY